MEYLFLTVGGGVIKMLKNETKDRMTKKTRNRNNNNNKKNSYPKLNLS